MSVNEFLRRTAVLLAATLTALPVAATPRIEQVVVLPVVVTGGIDPAQGPLVDDMLLTELTRRTPKGVKLVGSKDVTAVIGVEQQKQLLGCSDNACLVEIGSALGASHMLNASLGKLGSKFVLNVTLLEVSNAQALHRDSLYLDGSEDALIGGVAELCDRLVASEGWLEGAAWAGAAKPAAVTAEPTKPVPAVAVAPAEPTATGAETAEPAEAEEGSTFFWIGTGVAAVGAVAALGCGAATYVINDQVAQNLNQPGSYELAQAGLGTIAGTGLGLVALGAGGAMIALSMQEGE